MSGSHTYLFTSESVGEGHPDKVCDRISDSIVDLFLAADPHSRVAVETLATTNRIVLAGEIRGPSSITPKHMEEAAREAVREIGYAQKGFHWQWADLQNYVHPQSIDIALGVDANGDKDEGAGDQGIMFGYACRETPTYMPAPIFYAHKILRLISEDRHAGKLPLLGPDAKSQVTLEYVEGKPVRAARVVVGELVLDGAHHFDGADLSRLHYNLGGLYKAQRRFPEAESSFDDALAIWERTLGLEHPDLALAFQNLGDVCSHQGRSSEALLALKRALEILDFCKQQDWVTLVVLTKLATLYTDQERYSEAEANLFLS